MLFLFQSVHDDQNSRNYRKLEHLISFVVSPYLSSTGLRTKPVKQTVDSKASNSEEPNSVSEKVTEQETVMQSNRKPRPASAGSLELQSKFSADRLHEAALQSGQNRRFTYTSDSLTDSTQSSVFGSSSSTVT